MDENVIESTQTDRADIPVGMGLKVLNAWP